MTFYFKIILSYIFKINLSPGFFIWNLDLKFLPQSISVRKNGKYTVNSLAQYMTNSRWSRYVFADFLLGSDKENLGFLSILCVCFPPTPKSPVACFCLILYFHSEPTLNIWPQIFAPVNKLRTIFGRCKVLCRMSCLFCIQWFSISSPFPHSLP